MMKALVALTCVAVLGGVGYFVVNDQLDRKAATDLAETRSLWRTCNDPTTETQLPALYEFCLREAKAGRFSAVR